MEKDTFYVIYKDYDDGEYPEDSNSYDERVLGIFPTFDVAKQHIYDNLSKFIDDFKYIKNPNEDAYVWKVGKRILIRKIEKVQLGVMISNLVPYYFTDEYLDKVGYYE